MGTRRTIIRNCDVNEAALAPSRPLLAVGRRHARERAAVWVAPRQPDARDGHLVHARAAHAHAAARRARRPLPARLSGDGGEEQVHLDLQHVVEAPVRRLVGQLVGQRQKRLRVLCAAGWSERAAGSGAAGRTQAQSTPPLWPKSGLV